MYDHEKSTLITHHEKVIKENKELKTEVERLNENVVDIEGKLIKRTN